jgi:hypothetical protein
MIISDKKLRLYGQVSFAIIYFIFFNAFMFFYPYKSGRLLLVQMIASTVFFILTTWEPARAIILWARRSWGRQKDGIKRKFILAAILVPYAIVVSLARIYLENRFIWPLPVDSISFYFSIVGINLLFIVVQVALYESLFFVEEWHKSQMEAKELKKLNLQMQFDSLKVQIQPHFLFNTLNTLVGLIEIDQARAVKFTEGLAHVYRYLLEATDRALIGLDEELKFAKAYYFLLKNRYPEGLYLDCELQEDALEAYAVPPLSIQLLLENAIKHNIITKARPLRIQIKMEADGQLTVSNNLQPKGTPVGTGMGLLHLQKKFERLNAGKLVVYENRSIFSVTLPIIKLSEYESADH